MNRKKYRNHPIVIELKKKSTVASHNISLVQSITDEDFLSYIAIYIKDDIIRRTAFLQITDELVLKQTIEKIKEIENTRQVTNSFFDE